MPDFDGALLFGFVLALFTIFLAIFNIRDARDRKFACYIAFPSLLIFLALTISVAFHFQWESDLLAIHASPEQTTYKSQSINASTSPIPVTSVPVLLNTASPDLAITPSLFSNIKTFFQSISPTVYYPLGFVILSLSILIPIIRKRKTVKLTPLGWFVIILILSTLSLMGYFLIASLSLN